MTRIDINDKSQRMTRIDTNGKSQRMARMDANDILYKDESYKIIGAAMNVHNQLGCGFLEPVYQEALEIEMNLMQIPFQREVSFPIIYKGRELGKKYVADFVCYDKIIVELKALSALSFEHKAQVINYLKATRFELGLLINFGTTRLMHERVPRDHSRYVSTNGANLREFGGSANDAN